jgi:hypothetical protein
MTTANLIDPLIMVFQFVGCCACELQAHPL